jgi:hypothetical protein
VCESVFRKNEKNIYLVETLKHENMLGNLIIKDYSENSNSYRVPFSSVPVWTVMNGMGRCGTVWDGVGRCRPVWGGVGRHGTVWDGMGRGRKRRGRYKNRYFHCIIL